MGMVVTIVRILRRRRRAAALIRPALVSTLEQAGVRLADTTRFAGDAAVRVGVVAGSRRALRAVDVLVSGVGAAAVVVLGVEAELGLDGGGVDAVGVQAAADSLCQLHVARGALALEVELDLDVQAADELGVAELPDVDVVAGDDAGKVLDVGFDVLDGNAGGNSLEEDARSSLAKRDGRGEDNSGDDERDGRVHVEAPAEVGEPDEECGGNDADVTEGITQNVEEDTAHVEVTVRVAVATALLLLRLSVPVLLVVYRLALRAAVTRVLPAQERLARLSMCVGIIFVVLRSLVVVGAIFRFKILQAAGRNDGLAECVRVNVDVVETGIPGARTAVPAVLVPGRGSLIFHSGGLTPFGGLVGGILSVGMIVIMSMALFGLRDLIAGSVTVSAVAVSMSMLVKQEETHDIRSQTQASNNKNQLRLRDLLRLDKALNCLQEDANTEGYQEDTIDQRTEGLGALPSVCVHVRARLAVGDLDGPETDAEREDIVEHVEGVRDQGQRVNGISDGELEEEEDGVDDQ